MILAGFLTIGNRGFWLPNDERGSWSTHVRAPHLQKFGPATKTDVRHSVAHRPFDRQRRDAARAALKYPPVVWTAAQIDAIAAGLRSAIEKFSVIIHAAAFMPDHTHLVIARHARTFESLSGELRREMSSELTRRGLHPYEPFRDPDTQRVPSPYANGPGWIIYLNTPDQIKQKITYTEQNPVKAGLPRQHWTFVKPYPPL